jgi:hypothetical protein
MNAPDPALGHVSSRRGRPYPWSWRRGLAWSQGGPRSSRAFWRPEPAQSGFPPCRRAWRRWSPVADGPPLAVARAAAPGALAARARRSGGGPVTLPGGVGVAWAALAGPAGPVVVGGTAGRAGVAGACVVRPDDPSWPAGPVSWLGSSGLHSARVSSTVTSAMASQTGRHTSLVIMARRECRRARVPSTSVAAGATSRSTGVNGSRAAVSAGEDSAGALGMGPVPCGRAETGRARPGGGGGIEACRTAADTTWAGRTASAMTWQTTYEPLRSSAPAGSAAQRRARRRLAQSDPVLDLVCIMLLFLGAARLLRPGAPAGPVPVGIEFGWLGILSAATLAMTRSGMPTPILAPGFGASRGAVSMGRRGERMGFRRVP